MSYLNQYKTLDIMKKLKWPLTSYDENSFVCPLWENGLQYEIQRKS